MLKQIEVRKICSVILTFFVVTSFNCAWAYVCTTNDVITVYAAAGTKSGSATINPSLSPGNPFDWDAAFNAPESSHSWTLPANEDFYVYDGDGAPLAHVFQLAFTMQADPVMDFSFSVDTTNGLDTSFVISSPLISFSQLSSPDANAYSSISVGIGDTLTGNLPGDKIYRAAYNGTQSFADLVSSPIYLPPLDDEGTGWQPISGDVTSMQGIYEFTLSGGGEATAISEFEIVPEPATICLLGLGSLLFLKKRRE